MTTPAEQPTQAERLLRSLAETYLWFAAPDEQQSIARQLRDLLGRQDDEAFDPKEWARDFTHTRQIEDWVSAEEERETPLVIRAGPYVGLGVGQWFNARNEIISAVQLHPEQRVVLAEAGVEWLEPSEVVAEMRQEIAAAVLRARFLGLDQATVEALCAEALTAAAVIDVAALHEETYATPTLGDGEGIVHLVQVTGVELRHRYEVKLDFDDGVSRVLDLAPLLQDVQFDAVRNPAMFIQLRVTNGKLRWPSGAHLDADVLRYYPALTPQVLTNVSSLQTTLP